MGYYDTVFVYTRYIARFLQRTACQAVKLSDCQTVDSVVDTNVNLPLFSSYFLIVNLRSSHCLPMPKGKLRLPDGYTKRMVSWGESPDASIDKITQYTTADRSSEVVQLGGFGQSFYAFEEHWQQGESLQAATPPSHLTAAVSYI